MVPQWLTFWVPMCYSWNKIDDSKKYFLTLKIRSEQRIGVLPDIKKGFSVIDIAGHFRSSPWLDFEHFFFKIIYVGFLGQFSCRKLKKLCQQILKKQRWSNIFLHCATQNMSHCGCYFAPWISPLHCPYLPAGSEVYFYWLFHQPNRYLGVLLLERLFWVVFFLKPKNTVCLQSNKISQSNKSTL